MADGSEVNWSSGKLSECVSLQEAVTRLQAGALEPGVTVDLGDGALAEFKEADAPDSFLARLLAHARLVGVAQAAEQSAVRGPVPLMVDSHAKALLDAIRNAR